MPKATLTFNLPEENGEHKLAISASALLSVLCDLDNHLRSEIKYNNAGKETEAIRAKLWELLNDEKLDLWEF